MANNDGLRKYIAAGAVLGQVTRARAEELVRELVSAGELQREHAQRWVDELVDQSRHATEAIVTAIREEVAGQLGALGITSVDDLAQRVADVLQRSATAGRSVASRQPPSGRRGPAGTKAPAKKAPAKKAPAKKGAAKKAQAKKGAAKKAPAKKGAVKATKASAKKAAGRSTAVPAPSAPPGPPIAGPRDRPRGLGA